MPRKDFIEKTQFSVSLIYKIPHDNKFIDKSVEDSFWMQEDERNLEEIRDKKGCYVFGIRASKGIIPYYIGKATKSFSREVFTSDKLQKYNSVLHSISIGTPILFFIILPIKRGKTNNKHITELESFLIQTGMVKNRKLVNIQGTKLVSWSIKNILRSGKGKPSKCDKEFKKMMGL